MRFPLRNRYPSAAAPAEKAEVKTEAKAAAPAEKVEAKTEAKAEDKPDAAPKEDAAVEKSDAKDAPGQSVAKAEDEAPAAKTIMPETGLPVLPPTDKAENEEEFD